MNKPLELAVQKFITDNKKDLVQLIIDISAIPSPTGSEQKKAEWILEKLNSWGADGAYIDEAGNVIYPYHLEKSDTFPLYNAHIDTVFNNVTTIEPKIDGHTCSGWTDERMHQILGAAGLVALVAVSGSR